MYKRSDGHYQADCGYCDWRAGSPRAWRVCQLEGDHAGGHRIGGARRTLGARPCVEESPVPRADYDNPPHYVLAASGVNSRQGRKIVAWVTFDAREIADAKSAIDENQSRYLALPSFTQYTCYCDIPSAHEQAGMMEIVSKADVEAAKALDASLDDWHDAQYEADTARRYSLK